MPTTGIMTGESEKKMKLTYGMFIGVGDELCPCIITMYVLSAILCCTSSHGAVLPLNYYQACGEIVRSTIPNNGKV